MGGNTAAADVLMDIIRRRRSVREYLPDPVPERDIETIVTAALWAPSGSNAQNWHFIIVTAQELKDRMAAAVRETAEELSARIESPTAKRQFASYSNGYFVFFAGAPAVVAVVRKPYDSLSTRIVERYGIDTGHRSTAGIQGPSAAVENMLLMAEAMGYGTCWMTGPLIAKPRLEEMLGIREPDELMALVTLGKPARATTPPKRKPAREVMTTF